MPEINVLPQSLDPGTAAGPEALVETPGALAVRLFAATMRATGRGPATGGAMLVPASDIRAFDAALEAAEGDEYGLGMSVAQPTPGPGPGSLPRMPSGTPGSMAEMTQTLGVYRDANAIAQPTHASAPHSAATLTQQPTLVSAPQPATVSTPLPAASMSQQSARVPGWAASSEQPPSAASWP